MTAATDALEQGFINRTLNAKRRNKMLDRQTDPPPVGEPTVTISEVSKVLGTTRPSIYRAVESGKLTTYKLGDYRVTTEPQLSRWKGEAMAQKIMAGAQWLRYGDVAVAEAHDKYPDEDYPLPDGGADEVISRAIARVLGERATGREAVTDIVMEEWAQALEEGA